MTTRKSSWLRYYRPSSSRNRRIREKARGEKGQPGPVAVHAEKTKAAEDERREVHSSVLGQNYVRPLVKLSPEAVIFAVALFRHVIDPIIAEPAEIEPDERTEPVADGLPGRGPQPNEEG